MRGALENESWRGLDRTSSPPASIRRRKDSGKSFQVLSRSVTRHRTMGQFAAATFDLRDFEQCRTKRRFAVERTAGAARGRGRLGLRCRATQIEARKILPGYRLGRQAKRLG